MTGAVMFNEQDDKVTLAASRLKEGARLYQGLLHNRRNAPPSYLVRIPPTEGPRLA